MAGEERGAGSGRSPMGRRISHSQLHPCGLQVKYHRDRAPRGPQGISLVYGTAVHAGIEHQAKYRKGPDAAVEAALKELRQTVAKADEPGARPLRWDDPPQLTRAGAPYKGQEGRICDLAQAEEMLTQHVRSWVDAFGKEPVAHTEKTIFIKLRRPEGWQIECRLDQITKAKVIRDIKTANASWGPDKIQNAKPQAWLYMAAYRQEFGEKPAGFEFHVLAKGTTGVDVFPIPYDPQAINRYLELVVRQHIAAIEAGVHIPNTQGWWHSSRFCDYWDICPLGAAADPMDPAPVPAQEEENQ